MASRTRSRQRSASRVRTFGIRRCLTVARCRPRFLAGSRQAPGYRCCTTSLTGKRLARSWHPCSRTHADRPMSTAGATGPCSAWTSRRYQGSTGRGSRLRCCQM
eukprot:6420509-Prymnesium_polylepis.1